MIKIASVAVSNATRKFDKDYHYIIPDKYIDSIVPGMRVIVPSESQTGWWRVMSWSC
ncbi:hypothetical protein [Acetivibrio straminisolvens]|uniref:Helicase PriA n=1 Tax=Acetivibrio straminisolvens JCM 21531 TaxID=1294263 RepID=W4V158_9FIRM|nr:hypothetical protein [Acetivibrio straminisolvens]GAE86837.1 helicase PriA [Acetivibrio straminisolvens JCM 21531]